MRPLRWVNHFARTWWPLTASVMAGVVIYTVIYIFATVVDERRYFEAEQERDRRQDEQVQRLLEQQEAAATRSERDIADALADAELLLLDHFARHDLNVATKLNDLLAQIATLLERPVPQPVVMPSSAPPHRLDPGPTAPPSPVTPTTTPDQRRCAHDPTHPRC